MVPLGRTQAPERTGVVGYPSYRVSDPHVRVPLVLTAVDLEVVRWELVLEVDLVS